jgi:hypothetical protein
VTGISPGEPVDTPFPTEEQPLTPLADGRRGTASALGSSEAEKDWGPVDPRPRGHVV